MARRTAFTITLAALLLASAAAVALAASEMGTDGDDRIVGTADVDRLAGAAGKDLIVGQGADDAISGGIGDDRLDGGAGIDTITGDPGKDTVRGGGERDFLSGDSGDDELHGDEGSNVIDGGGGNDTIEGGDRVDSLNGGADDDTIRGGDGNDGITGASGRDHLDGGGGADRIEGGLGQDLIQGGDGGDNIVAIDGQPDRVECGRGRDVIRADAGDDIARDCERVIQRRGSFGKKPDTDQQPSSDLSSFPTQSGAFGADTLAGGGGIDVIAGGGAGDTITGGAERDFLEGGPDDDTIDGEAGSNIVNGASGNDNLTGGDKSDSLNGGSDEDTLTGGPGDDGITGASGRDTIFGGPGDDRIEGGLGKDLIFAQDGGDNIVAADGQQDEIHCGRGRDVVRADGGDKVDDDCETLIARVGDRYERIPVSERLPMVGVADQQPASFNGESFQDLGVRRSRVIVPYNVVDEGPARLDQWLRNARAAGVVYPLVAFNHDVDAKCPDDPCRAPSLSAYREAFRKFRERYPNVIRISPWNEANHQTQPVANNPKRAAQYYNVVREECRECEIVAVDLLDQGNMLRYLRSFLRYADGQPDVFGIHNYRDVNYQDTRLEDERTGGTRDLIEELEDQARRDRAASDFEVWMTETGGIYAFETSSGRTIFRADEDRQADKVREMFRLASGLRERVREVYVYQWRKTNDFDRFDAGLVGANGDRREAYSVVAARDQYIR